MPYKNIPKDHGEFSGGPGVIDPVLRGDRLVTAEDELREIYATKAYIPESGSVPPAEQQQSLQPENFPETSDVDRKGLGPDYPSNR